jgi:hypothetical protein
MVSLAVAGSEQSSLIAAKSPVPSAHVQGLSCGAFFVEVGPRRFSAHCRAHKKHHVKFKRRTNNRGALSHRGDAMAIDPRTKRYLRLFGSAALLLLAAGMTFFSAVVMFMD